MVILKKKLKISFFFSILISLIFIFNAIASEQEVQLNKLFNQLKESTNNLIAQEVEQKIWKVWSTHPKDKKLTSMLAKGSNLVNNGQFKEAINIFSKVIDLDPSWAEAWNKRATVMYMIGEFQKSQQDINKVLELENRHFGAFAGQGLVNIELKNYEKAIKSYENAQKIYPLMKSPSIMINQIEVLIKKELI
jgi:tetratricopeptide (TPR) repeat protein|tara:strand:- start:87 stop:662 length:576 start_codon:yes stop_codon:yes gene_type:complete